jgi:glyoxylase-like metal-dependent hydrolase (beta-lactamase superfamily II)
MSSRRKNHCFVVVLFFWLMLATLPIQCQNDRKITKLAEGVYEIEHTSHPFVNSNTTVIIGDRQVFVVDTCFRPLLAEEDIAQIHQWTNKPVSFVLNTHFHNDHNLGNRAYASAFPAVTIIAHTETKRDMDAFGPSSARRTEGDLAPLREMLSTGKAPDGTALSNEDTTAVKNMLNDSVPVLEELKKTNFQSATLTFDHDFTIDLGNREVQVKFLGRGNTAGDAIAYLPKEKIVIAGDLVVYPIPYILDGYPVEWIQTLQNLSQLDADTIIPGHGPVMHDKNYVYLLRDLMQSAVDQMNTKLRQTRPAMAQNLDDVKGSVDLTAFRPRFAGSDKDLAAQFDDMSSHLVKLVFLEASLR